MQIKPANSVYLENKLKNEPILNIGSVDAAENQPQKLRDSFDPKRQNNLGDELRKLHFENWSFRQDRPQKFRLKYQGARDVVFWKSIFSSRSPRDISFSISQHRPQTREARNRFEDTDTFSYHVNVFSVFGDNIALKRAQRGNFWRSWKIVLPCGRIFLVWKWTMILTSPQARATLNVFEMLFISRLRFQTTLIFFSMNIAKFLQIGQYVSIKNQTKLNV